jgi:hypothetical protein
MSQSGPQLHQVLATLYVTSSFALFALGSSNPIGRFWLGTLSVRSPSTIVGLFWIWLLYPSMWRERRGRNCCGV